LLKFHHVQLIAEVKRVLDLKLRVRLQQVFVLGGDDRVALSIVGDDCFDGKQGTMTTLAKVLLVFRPLTLKRLVM
jgi:hypothetical protein